MIGPETAESLITQTITEGGITVDADGRTVERDTGYAVAVRGGAIVAMDDSDVAAGTIREFSRKLDTYLGLWYNDGQIYIDRVIIVDNHDDAIALAKSEAQLAIYDFAKRSVETV